MSSLSIDFETRSRVDLFKQGAFIYAADESTDVLCMAYAIGDADPVLWLPGQPFPAEIRQALNDGAIIKAWNAQFEYLIWHHVMVPRYGAPRVGLSRFYCTAAQSRARALPGSLDDAARCMKLAVQKDARGKDLIKALSVPTYDPETGEERFNEDPDLMREMGEYCLTDVLVERTVGGITPPLTEEEHRDWVIAEKINQTGLRIDRELAEAATAYADVEIDEIKIELEKLTGGVITSPKQYQRIKDFMAPFAEADPRIARAMKVVKTDRREGTTTTKIAFDGDVRRKIMNIDEAEPGTVPAIVMDLVRLVDDASASSVTKFRNMMLRASPADDRVRGAYIYAGAGQTGRYSSTGTQLHNFPRKCAKDPEAVRAKILARETLDGGIMATLASMLRPAILPAPGHTLVWGDWASIEARILPWLAQNPDRGAWAEPDVSAQKVLDAFFENDADPSLPDIYVRAVADHYGIDAGDIWRGLKSEDDATKKIAKDHRALGKVVVLSTGYQGAVGAFQQMARSYAVNMPDDEAMETVYRWRAMNPWAPAFWRALETAAKGAVRRPGVPFTAGRLTYMKPSDDAPLYCQLPSGRMLSYPDARLETVDGVHGPETALTAIKAQWKPRQGEEDWGRVNLYGGLLAENCLAGDTEVLTEHGWVPIRQYAPGTRLWDGVDWVEGGALLDQGIKETIDYAGVQMTPDHLVLTTEGWRNAATSQSEGLERAAVRPPAGYRIGGERGWETSLAGALRVRQRNGRGVVGIGSRAGEILRLLAARHGRGQAAHARNDESSGVRGLAQYARSLPATLASGMEELRRAGDHYVRAVAGNLRELLGGHGAFVPAGAHAGQDRQQRRVLAGELPLDRPQDAVAEHSGQPRDLDALGAYHRGGGERAIRGEAYHNPVPAGSRVAGGPDVRQPGQRAARRVFDIANVGTRNRFTVRGRDGCVFVVHNCTQAAAADILRHGLRLLDDDGWTPVGTTHDEIILEPADDEVEDAVAELEAVMREVPSWAPGLPLACEVETGKRYRK